MCRPSLIFMAVTAPPEVMACRSNCSSELQFQRPRFQDRITHPNDRGRGAPRIMTMPPGNWTRLNVYARGLAGFYLLRDDNSQHLIDTGVLPGGSNEVEMAIQDRAFTADGQLYYPAYKHEMLPGTTDMVGDVVPQTFDDANGEDAPSAVPSFLVTTFGDGMAWPNLRMWPPATTSSTC